MSCLKTQMPILPLHMPGLRIGLLGGSFNPPHAGHRLASLTAFKHLNLDRIWWVVTPGNPLKNNRDLPSLAERMALARVIKKHPRIEVTGFEADIGTRYTYHTLLWLKQHCPGVEFIWIMGADNLAGFHRWRRWRDIAQLVPLAIIDRPGSTLKAVRSPAAITLAAYRAAGMEAKLISKSDLPAWVFIHGQRSSLSSTLLRKQALAAN